MTKEELREYCKNASLEISNMQHTIDKYKIVLDKIKDYTERTIEIIKQQPTEDDNWILDRLNGYIKLLEEIENE